MSEMPSRKKSVSPALRRAHQGVRAPKKEAFNKPDPFPKASTKKKLSQR